MGLIEKRRRDVEWYSTTIVNGCSSLSGVEFPCQLVLHSLFRRSWMSRNDSEIFSPKKQKFETVSSCFSACGHAVSEFRKTHGRVSFTSRRCCCSRKWSDFVVMHRHLVWVFVEYLPWPICRALKSSYPGVLCVLSTEQHTRQVFVCYWCQYFMFQKVQPIVQKHICRNCWTLQIELE